MLSGTRSFNCSSVMSLGAFQFVAISGFLIEERGWFGGLKLRSSHEPTLFIREVVMLERSFRVNRNKVILESHAIIPVFLESLPQCLHDLFGTQRVCRIRRA